jgi:hypothetical protein
MVSGLAPGKLACTEMVGKSTWGKGATGNWRPPGGYHEVHRGHAADMIETIDVPPWGTYSSSIL